MNQPRREKSKGFVLVTSYFFITAMTMLSLAFMTRGHVFVNSAERNANRMTAFNMAEAGADLADGFPVGGDIGAVDALDQCPHSSDAQGGLAPARLTVMAAVLAPMARAARIVS